MRDGSGVAVVGGGGAKGCFSLTTFLLTIWAVEEVGTEITGHLLTNASCL